jgi:hypothetical protein
LLIDASLENIAPQVFDHTGNTELFVKSETNQHSNA